MAQLPHLSILLQGILQQKSQVDSVESHKIPLIPKSNQLKRKKTHIHDPEEEEEEHQRGDGYDGEVFPPNIEFAKNHAKANRVARPPKEASLVCKCCGLPIENELLPLNCSLNELKFLGPGFPLYFQFMINCILMLVLSIMSVGMYAMVTNLRAGDCNLKEVNEHFVCDRNVISKISVSNKHNQGELYYEQAWVNLGATVIIMISLHGFRYFTNQSEREIDEGLISPSDYTVMIRGLPELSSKDFGPEALKSLLDPLWRRIPKSTESSGNQTLEIEDMHLAMDISKFTNDLLSIKAKYDQDRRKAIKLERSGKASNTTQKGELKSKVQEICEEINKIEEEFKSEEKQSCGIAFASLKTQKMVQILLDQFEKEKEQSLRWNIKTYLGLGPNTIKLPYQGQELDIEIVRAPEPNDVLWENLGYSDAFRLRAKLRTGLATAGVLGLCFALILTISYLQELVVQKYKGNKGLSSFSVIILMSCTASILIVTINSLLFLAMKKFGKNEKHMTWTHYEISISNKVSLAQFINTGIIVFLANVLIQGDVGIYGQGALVSDAFWIFISNALIPPIISFLDPFHYQRVNACKILEKERNESIMTQNEANSLYEGPKIDLSLKYASYMNSMWLTAFYTPILPFGNIITLIGFIISYWVDKYLILRRFSRPYLRSADLNRDIIESLEYFPFAMACGNLIFHKVLYNSPIGNFVPDIMAIILTSINFISPQAKVNKMLFNVEKQILLDPNYQEARFLFSTNYAMEDPVTSDVAKEAWLELLEERRKMREPNATGDVSTTGVTEAPITTQKRDRRASLNNYTSIRGDHGRRVYMEPKIPEIEENQALVKSIFANTTEKQRRSLLSVSPKNIPLETSQILSMEIIPGSISK